MRVDLRLGDLRSRGRVTSKLMNVKIPTEVNRKIQKVAEALRASKTEVVIALLNEGLDVSESVLRGTRPPQAPPRPSRSPKSGACAAAGCRSAAVARGLCRKHDQAARRKKQEK